MNLLDKFHSLHSTKIEKTFIGLGTWEKLHLLAEIERESVFVCVCDRERYGLGVGERRRNFVRETFW